MKQQDVVAIGFIIFKKRAGEIELLSVSDSIREVDSILFQISISANRIVGKIATNR